MSEENVIQKPQKKIWVLAGLGVLVAVVVLGVLLQKTPSNGLSIKKAEALTQTLNTLKLGVDISHFNQSLGEPKLKGDKTIKMISYSLVWHGTPKKEVREVPYIEYFYSHPHFYVQAITDPAGKVGFYSITTKTAEFQPKISTGLNEFVELGKSVYQSLPKLPYKVAGRLAETPKNAAYYEIYALEAKAQKFEIYSSNPNGYLKDAVALDEKTAGFLVSKISEATPFPITTLHDTFRKATLINTYSAASAEFEGIDTSTAGMNYGETKISFGPREDQVNGLK
ncbi:MAG: hypothetical protein RL497_1678 [Pseudomonadota bacterium]